MTKEIPVAEAITPRGKGASVTPGARDLDWAEVESRLTTDGWRWLATVRPDGAPHVMPVFGAWSESVVFVASKDTARKSRNLDADGRCVLATDVVGVHLVVEGEARRGVSTTRRRSSTPPPRSSGSTGGRLRSQATSSTPSTARRPRAGRRTASTR
jgi:hypothetical protein